MTTRQEVPQPAGRTSTARTSARGLVHAEGQDGHRGALGQGLVAGVVGVEDGPLGPRLPLGVGPVRAQQVEQPGLGLQVGGVRAVVVQVLVRDAGDHRHVELAAGQAPLVEGVGGGLHHRPLPPAGQRLGQEGLHLHRLGGAGVGLVGARLAGRLGGHRADHPGAEAGPFQDRRGQGAGGGLAVRPGHPHHPQAGGGESVERGGEPAQGPGRVRDDHHRDAGRGRHRTLHHGGDGAVGEGLGRELVRIVDVATVLAGDEERPRDGPPAVVDDPRDLRVGARRRRRPPGGPAGAG